MITSVLIAGTSDSCRLCSLPLIFDKIARLEHLADIVEIGPDAHQQPIGADRFGGGIGDRSDVDGMVVCSWCAAHEFLQQRMRDIAQFQQADIGLNVEQPFR